MRRRGVAATKATAAAAGPLRADSSRKAARLLREDAKVWRGCEEAAEGGKQGVLGPGVICEEIVEWKLL